MATSGAAGKPTILAFRIELYGEFCFSEVKTGQECCKGVVDVANIRFALDELLVRGTFLFFTLV